MAKKYLWRFGAFALIAVMGCAADRATTSEEETEPSPGVDELAQDEDSPGVDSTEQGLHGGIPVLVGRWRFNEDGGQTLGDSSGSGNHAVRGTNANAQPSDPQRINVEGHRALRFDGNDVARVIGMNRLQPREVSIEAYIRLTSTPSTTQYIVSKGAQDCASPSYALYFDNGNLKFIVTPQNGSFRETDGYAASNLADGDWHQIVGTYNGRGTRLYIDGELVDTTTHGTEEPIRYGLSVHNRLLFGRFNGSGPGCDLFYTGQLDNVRVYRNPLNASDVRDRFEGREVRTDDDEADN